MSEVDDWSDNQPINVLQLQAYWKKIEALKVGEVCNSVHSSYMPPWASICEGLSWRYRHLNRGYFAAKDYGFPGVYRLVALTDEADFSKPATFNRLCGQDTSGTLYIGESSNISRRLNEVRRSNRRHRRENSHASISRWDQIAKLAFPTHKLAVAFIFTGKITEAIERDLIDAYRNTFGDAPPLNYRG